MLTKKETEAVVSAFMAALMTGPYGDISLRAVAEAAKVPLTKLVMHGATRADLLAAFADRIDAIVVDGDDPGMMEEPPRERLFDVMMRRYDALLPHKLALIQLERDARRDPALALDLVRLTGRSLQRMAASVGVDAQGPRGMVVMAGLAGIHARVLRVWLKESDEGQAKTMAELDRLLREAERRIGDLDRVARIVVDRDRRGCVLRRASRGASTSDPVSGPLPDAPPPDAPPSAEAA